MGKGRQAAGACSIRSNDKMGAVLPRKIRECEGLMTAQKNAAGADGRSADIKDYSSDLIAFVPSSQSKSSLLKFYISDLYDCEAATELLAAYEVKLDPL